MQTESFTLKSTPAAKLFLRFIAAFNTGNPDKITSFVEENYDESILAQNPVDEIVNYYLNLYQQCGGMHIHKVYLSQEHYIIVIVEQKADKLHFMDKLKITRQHPYKIIEYYHEPAP